MVAIGTMQMQDQAPFFKAHEIGYAILGRTILKDLSFEIGAGQFFGLLGLNGAGKSLLIQLLAGTRNWQSGTVTFLGKQSQGVDPRCRRDLGCVFQTLSLDQKLTAKQNLYLAGRLYGIPTKVLQENYNEVVEALQITTYLSDQVSKLSGGQKRKIDLARVLITKPKLVLLDEPTAHLDVPSSVDFWESLKQARAKFGTSVLLATHKPEEAQICDVLGVLSEGKWKAYGTVQGLLQSLNRDLVVLSEVQNLSLVRETLKSTPGIVSIQEKEGNLYCKSDTGPQVLRSLMDTLPRDVVGQLSVRRSNLGDFMERHL